MKILVFSDSHGAMGKMVEAMEHERPHHVFFLGDHYRDGIELSQLYPDIPMDIVRGNCDWGKGPDLRVVELEGVRFLLTHGHLQYVKSGLDELLQEAKNRQVQVACFGHTHLAKVVYRDGIYLMNPGSAGGCYAREGYGVIEALGGSVNLLLK
ncbi:MAG TPA: YfcE family phosphodiesterase [Candidatus Enterenecus faecium]|uniref:Phosphoesterase n=1 Tax=Candidatus Enterenecus faecium TaxID=2840780 RepID=A0A9D0YU80_9FIRM|nr:YfcE family phosphodiesterase [Candidatus Enterenecus faecium]